MILPNSKLIDTSSAIKLRWPLVHIEPDFSEIVVTLSHNWLARELTNKHSNMSLKCSRINPGQSYIVVHWTVSYFKHTELTRILEKVEYKNIDSWV